MLPRAPNLYLVFMIDLHNMESNPNTHSPGSARARVRLNRIRFLLEKLVDLDLSLYCKCLALTIGEVGWDGEVVP
jgi:hypothetical protein